MKSLRIWLLVLLAFVLPIRGAMAAAMLCGPATAQDHVVSATVHVHDHDHEHEHEHEHGGDAPSTTASAVHDHGASAADHAGTDKCSFCASCCSAAAPPTLAVTLPQAPLATADFPADLAPDPEFVSGGQERPPRST